MIPIYIYCTKGKPYLLDEGSSDFPIVSRLFMTLTPMKPRTCTLTVASWQGARLTKRLRRVY
jgi:hypothetical protein